MSDQEHTDLQAELLKAVTSFANRFEREFHISADELSRTQLTVALVGTVNVGKSSTINALFRQEDLAAADPLPGFTKKVEPFKLADNFTIVDTPGLEDVDETLSKQTEEFVKGQADIVIFLVDATVGVTRPVKASYTGLLNTGKPIILVVNKIDAVRPQTRVQAVLDDVARKLGVAKVIGLSAVEGTNVDLLAKEIFSQLESNKQVLFLRYLKDREPLVRSEILRATAAAAGIGLVPIPFSDLPFITGVQMWMCIRIAHIYGIKVNKADALRFMGSALGAIGFIGRSLFRQVIKIVGDVTGIGAIASSGIAAGIAGAMTYGLGFAASEFYKSGMTLETAHIQALFKEAYDRFDLAQVRQSLGLTADGGSESRTVELIASPK